MNPQSPLDHIKIDRTGWSYSVQLFDSYTMGKLTVEGQSTSIVLQTVFGVVPTANGEVVTGEDGIKIGRITPTRYLLITPPNQAQIILTQIKAEIGYFITITDNTNGQGAIKVTGEEATDLLSKLCGLDFHPSVFPPNTVKSSSFAKVRATIWCLEEGYLLFFGRSLTAYVLNALLDLGKN